MILLANILALLFLKLGFGIQAYVIPSASMLPTLVPGDCMWSGHNILSPPYRVGDVVFFHHHGDVWVKRIVALPGDRIALHDGVVTLNGQAAPLQPEAADEPTQPGFPEAKRFVETLPGSTPHSILKLTSAGHANNMPEFTVPPGHAFVLGDNRDDSMDSRFVDVGPVPLADLIGRPGLIYWSKHRSRMFHTVR